MKNNKKSNLHQGHRDRLRKKLNYGVDGMLENHEILELLLFQSVKRRNTNDIAHELLNECGSLEKVLDADIKTLKRVQFVGNKSATLLMLLGEIKKRKDEDEQSMRDMFEKLLANKVETYVKDICTSLTKEGMYITWIDGEGKPVVTQYISDIGNDDVKKRFENATPFVTISGVAVIDFCKKNSDIPSNIQLERAKAIKESLKVRGMSFFEYFVTNEKMAYSISSLKER